MIENGATNSSPAASAAQPRVPPHSIEAEACVLGSMILDSACIDIVVQILKGKAFYRPAHQIIFDTLVEMRNNRKEIDLVAVPEELKRIKQLTNLGGVEYLVALVEGVPNSANAEYYAHIVRDKKMLRDLIQAGTDMVREAYDSHEETQSIIDHSEQRVFEIASQKISQQTASMKDLILDTFRMLESRDGKLVTGLASGYDKLDNLTCGFQNGEMIILAARPSMGKTSALMNVAEYMAVVEKQPVAIFSLEMSKEQLAQRLLASYARFDMQKMRRGIIGPEDWTTLQTAAADLEHAPIYIDDTALITILELRAKSRRLAAQYGIKAVFIDYLQLMNYAGRADSRQEQITEISRGIKALARELNIPVIVAAQLNRGPEDRPGHRPRMSDLRESGSIEQDADVVMLLHNEDYYHRGEVDYVPSNITELIIAKQRNGPTDTVELVFIPHYTRFESAAPGAFVPQG